MPELYRAAAFGLPWLADIAPFLARLVVGGMFLLSGFYKLFSAENARKMQQTMVEAGVAAPRQTARFVSICEVVFGGLLILGLLNSLAALGLLILSLVALVTVARKQVKGTSFGYRLSSYLDLPETLLIVILIWLIAIGPGLYSLDAGLFS
jgi:putative oxidoreductase